MNTPKATHGKVIVKFHAYRRNGKMIIPDKHKPQPVECTIIDDSKGGEWNGLLAIAALSDGTYFEHEDETYCVMQRRSILLFYTEANGKTVTVRPALRGVIVEDKGYVEMMGSFFLPQDRKPPFGRVLAVGPGRWDFREGDVVHFDRNKALGLTIDEKKAIFVFESSVYAMEEAA